MPLIPNIGVVVDCSDCRLREDRFGGIGDLAGDRGICRLAERQARDNQQDCAKRQHPIVRHKHTSIIHIQFTLAITYSVEVTTMYRRENYLFSFLCPKRRFQNWKSTRGQGRVSSGKLKRQT
jgi:hypothetical protein